ncbi:MAG: HPP family protein [Deltaproteobacteria bacterium]|nr:HPP family protein [Deltaproteobacteria bacterium]
MTTFRGERGLALRSRLYLGKVLGRGHGRPAGLNPPDGPLLGVGDMLWSCGGSFLGIFVLFSLDNLLFTGDQHLLLGSFGASGLIIFGAPHSEFARARSVVGGQVISSLVGVSVFMLLEGRPILAAALAVSLALAAMRLTGTLHPPGGATALLAVTGHPMVVRLGYGYALMPVGAGIVILFLLGVLINNLSPHRFYPLRW